MFTKISNPTTDVYNRNTGQYLGISTYNLSPEAEKKLLNLVNFGVEPSNLLLLDVSLRDYPEEYVPPSVTEVMERKGILKANFTDPVTSYTVPIEIYFDFDARARGVVPGYPYYLNSVQYENININAIKRLEFESL